MLPFVHRGYVIITRSLGGELGISSSAVAIGSFLHFLFFSEIQKLAQHAPGCFTGSLCCIGGIRTRVRYWLWLRIRKGDGFLRTSVGIV